MALPNYLRTIKSSGMYRFTFDKSEIPGELVENLRLIVGYSEKGPFNTPVYVDSPSKFIQIFGGINKKLERRGCFFHRMSLQALAVAPVVVLNLKPFNTVESKPEELSVASFNPSDNVAITATNVLKKWNVENVYNTTRFWTLEPSGLGTRYYEELVNGTQGGKEKYITVSATDSVNTSCTYFIRGYRPDGYNITFSEWYSSVLNGEELPSYLEGHEYDKLEEYFAEVFVFRGQMTPAIATSESLSKYFIVENGNVTLRPFLYNAFGDKIDTLSALSNDSNSNFVGWYSGILIPEFKGSNGSYISLDLAFNSDYDNHKMMMNLNIDALYDGNVTLNDINMAGWTRISQVEGNEIGTLTPDFNTLQTLSFNGLKPTASLLYTFDGTMDSIGDGYNEPNLYIYINGTEVIDTSVVGQISIDKLFPVETPNTDNTGGTSDAGAGTGTDSGDNDLDDTTEPESQPEAQSEPETTETEEFNIAGHKTITKPTGFFDALSVLSVGTKILCQAKDGGYVTSTITNVTTGDIIENDDVIGTTLTLTYETDGVSSPLFTSIKTETVEGQTVTTGVESIAVCNTFVTTSCDEMTPAYFEGYTYNLIPPTSKMSSKLEWQDKIFRTLVDYEGIRIALTSRKDIQYHYLIDTFESFIGTEIKSTLSLIAKDKDNALALCNFPSMTSFKNCDYTSFTDSEGRLQTRFIKEGGNKQKQIGRKFTLPSEGNGASFASFNTPIVLSDGTVKTTCPSAALVSNNFVAKYDSRFPYSIVAGPVYGNITAQGLVGPDFNFSRADLDNLEPMGVNCMVYEPGRGTYINSNQTAKQNPVTALSKINVRELVIFLQDEIEKMLQAYQWEFNTQALRDTIKSKADTICSQIVGNGGMYKFINVCDETNNTDDVINNEMLVLDTSIEPGMGSGKMVQTLTIYRKGGMSVSLK
jgi:hypothetical protein